MLGSKCQAPHRHVEYTVPMQTEVDDWSGGGKEEEVEEDDDDGDGD